MRSFQSLSLSFDDPSYNASHNIPLCWDNPFYISLLLLLGALCGGLCLPVANGCLRLRRHRSRASTTDGNMGDSPPLPQKQDNDDDTPLRAAVPVPLKIENPLLADNWADYIPTTDHVRFFRGTDWGRTCMGPLKTWSMPLRLQVFMVLADSRPACLYWYVLPLFASVQFFLPASLSRFSPTLDNSNSLTCIHSRLPPTSLLFLQTRNPDLTFIRQGSSKGCGLQC